MAKNRTLGFFCDHAGEKSPSNPARIRNFIFIALKKTNSPGRWGVSNLVVNGFTYLEMDGLLINSTSGKNKVKRVGAGLPAPLATSAARPVRTISHQRFNSYINS